MAKRKAMREAEAMIQAAASTPQAGLRREFIALLEDFAGHGRQRIPEAFREWVRFACLPVMEATCRFADDKEGTERYAKEYADTVRRRKEYCKDPVAVGGNMFAILMEALEMDRGDFLGYVMESIAATNPGTGQFFTPKHLAHMMARVVNGEVRPDEDGIVSVYEPCCGCGVLLLECCSELMERGVAQRDIWVDAADIDMGAYCCTYLQLSLLGYPGVVRLGDTLRMEFRETSYTLAGYLHGTIWRVRRERRRRGELWEPVSVKEMREIREKKKTQDAEAQPAPEPPPSTAPAPAPAPERPKEKISTKPMQGLLFEMK